MKIYKLLYNLSYKLRQKGLYYELKSHINDDYYVKATSIQERGTGKTHTLMQLSKKYNIPVLEPNESLKRMFKRRYPKAIVISPNDYIGKKFNTVLVDELQLLSKEQQKYINDHFKQIGFVSTTY